MTTDELEEKFKDRHLDIWGRPYNETHGPDHDEWLAYKDGYEEGLTQSS